MKQLLVVLVVGSLIPACSLAKSNQMERAGQSAPAEMPMPDAMRSIQSLIMHIIEYENSLGTTPDSIEELIKFKAKLSEFNQHDFVTLELRESADYRLRIYIKTKPDSFVYEGMVNYNTKDDFTTDLQLSGTAGFPTKTSNVK